MLNNKDRASLRSYENRLENEHNDPTPAYFEECSGYGRCDKLTEPTRNDELCSECMLPYGKNGDETVEYLQNQISDLESKLKDPFHLNCQLIEDTRIGLEKKVEEQAARIAELTRHRRQARESIHYWQGRHKEQAARIKELETTIIGYQTMYPPKNKPSTQGS